MALIDSLTTAQANIAARLAEVTTKAQPNYSVDGESYSWADYVSMLTGQLETIEKAIQRAGGPYQIISRGSP